MKISLNADMGESFGPYRMGDDQALMPYVSSANIACGMHAGDPNVMAATIDLAREHGVTIGAHPGFGDLHGFGRRRIPMTPPEIEHLVTYQIGALQALAAGRDVRVEFVKPHGALNNMAHEESDVADAVARGIRAASRDLLFVANCLSEMTRAADRAGLQVVHEAYADRRYAPDGRLLPRSAPEAVIRDPADAARQVLAMLDAGCLIAADGTRLSTPIDTFCLHADEATALEVAKGVRGELDRTGIAVVAIAGPGGSRIGLT
ncbi:hypothetical protein CH339_16020 [Rhodobium orientis]|uniref:5-oxoprolinase subunit A n=1 Tax=Rhodobium orientis TaxID=34017 RepID=A0A327JKT6_9HYPH|nr:5-oxoprolinase subunit PxpA [Rhodobium orientis]MBK5951331.1 hypothetical protein [Rhodobium orientis]RAI25944.1 hypothetical protein CH339_16020 [Rhodobium orientis]